MKFTEFNFSEQVLAGIQGAGFTECMPVQSEVFQHALEEKKDVTVQSRTGTGKTAAFLLTIFELFSRNPEKNHKALIIAPTRELAVQIEQEAKLLGTNLPYKVGSFYGGVGYKQQDQLLKEGVDIIIGTPGRLLDYAKLKKLQLKEVDILVIDEADRLFDMGFLPDLKKMLSQLVKPQERQTMLFSATLGTRVAHLAWDYMNSAEEIVIDNDRVTVDEITQELYHTSNEEKMQLLLGLLQREQPANAIIFSNTKDMAVKLAKRLELNGYHAEYIMGDLPQKKRLSIINRIKEGKLEILVATDVAARGLHINDLDLVINFDIPEDPENYVHRIGRTARAGKSGKAITLACEKFVYGLEAIHDFIGLKIPVFWPDESLLGAEDKSKGMRISGNNSQRERSSGKGRRSASTGRSRKPGDSRRSGDSRKTGDSRKSGGSGRSNRPATSNRTERSGGKSDAPQKPMTQSPPKKQPAAARSAKPGKHDDLDSRLEYYRKKYGEDFELKESTKSESSTKGSRPPQQSKQKKQSAAKSTSDNSEKSKKPGLLKRLFNKVSTK
ncbi:MAG: DEAD/DEAH box helicase [Spirochaetota bacterium]